MGKLSAANTTPGPVAWRWHFLATHFHDYNLAALRLWFAIALSGAVALVAALVWVASASAPDKLHSLLALGFVAVAAWFPVQIPRTKYLISAADVFVFLMLAVLGPGPAILGAGLDGVIGGWRGTKRLSSRISTPAAAMATWALCALLFDGVWRFLVDQGSSPPVARQFALMPVALLAFALPTFALMATVTLRKGTWPTLRNWFSSFSWLAGVYLCAALVAGLVQLNTIQHGMATLAAVALGVLAVVVLLRISIAHVESERRAQEARVTDAQQEAALNQLRFAAAFCHAAIGMAIVNPQGQIVRINQALCTLLRRDERQLTGQRFIDTLRPDDLTLIERQARLVAEHAGARTDTVELRCAADDGAEFWVALHCGRFQDQGSLEEGLIYQVQDISSRQHAEARLNHLAYHDSLTELPNRAYFQAQLGDAIEFNRSHPDARFAVLFLDLDRFKVVNDSLGHFQGNQLLREVGRRLQSCLRRNEIVARLGGDEFAVLLRELQDGDDGTVLADRILQVLARPMALGGTEVIPSASVGITFSDLGSRSADEILRDADVAMYEAKTAGRNRIAVFDRTMHERIADKLALESDLRHAIASNQMSIAFQPLYDLKPHRLNGFEALARWTHPTRGPISPAVFIPLAEESGYIEALTTWMVEKSVEQLAAWHRAAPHHTQLGISVNISARDLTQPGFVEHVLTVLHRHGVASSRLTLEITETVLMDKLEIVRDIIARLRMAGVRLAIDDFGTGYSSLSYLGNLPFDVLKIDRSFVVAMNRGPQFVEIVRTILSLGEALGKKVVAEGIETEDQLNTLRSMGVHTGQGYLLARPLPAERVPGLLYAPVEVEAAA